MPAWWDKLFRRRHKPSPGHEVRLQDHVDTAVHDTDAPPGVEAVPLVPPKPAAKPPKLKPLPQVKKTKDKPAPAPPPAQEAVVEPPPPPTPVPKAAPVLKPLPVALVPIEVGEAAQPLLALALQRKAHAIMLNPEEGTLDVWLVSDTSAERVTSTGPDLIEPTLKGIRALHDIRGTYNDIAFGARLWTEPTDLGARVVLQLDAANAEEDARNQRRTSTARIVTSTLPAQALTRNQNDEVLRLLEQHPPVPKLLEECFVRHGLTPETNVVQMLKDRRLPRKPVAKALACCWGVPYLDAETVDIGREAKDALDDTFCKAHTVICVHLDSHRGTLLMANPFHMGVLNEASRVTERKLFPALSSRQDLLQRIKTLYSGR